MHPSRAFHMEKADQVLDFVRAFPFAVVTAWDGAQLLTAQIPLIPVLDDEGLLTGFEGHVARANRLTRALAKKDSPVPGLAVFCGPDAYVSAGAYPSKADHGRAVPTWNYVSAEAQGVLTLTSGAETRSILERQTQAFEASEAQPWSMDDANAAYLDKLEAAIIGLRLDVMRFEGTEKISQNKAGRDFDGVIHALEAQQMPGAALLAARMKTLDRG